MPEWYERLLDRVHTTYLSPASRPVLSSRTFGDAPSAYTPFPFRVALLDLRIPPSTPVDGARENLSRTSAELSDLVAA